MNTPLVFSTIIQCIFTVKTVRTLDVSAVEKSFISMSEIIKHHNICRTSIGAWIHTQQQQLLGLHVELPSCQSCTDQYHTKRRAFRKFMSEIWLVISWSLCLMTEIKVHYCNFYYLKAEEGGRVASIFWLCQNAPINMQKHFLGSAFVFASSKIGKTASQHSCHWKIVFKKERMYVNLIVNVQKYSCPMSINSKT